MAPPRINTTVFNPGGVEFGGCGVSQVSPTDTTTLGTTIILPCPVTGSPPPQWLWYCGTQALYLNIHCVTTPLQHHLDQVWPRTAETPSVCTHSFQANIARPGRRTEEEQYRMVQYLQGQDTIDSTSCHQNRRGTIQLCVTYSSLQPTHDSLQHNKNERVSRGPRDAALPHVHNR
ncbi:hypothetical protein Pcinc_017192 [Petrolisthes cinctipes]|uniref:Ig-like domain-containing protein n=1 Tax=Petrolisthes cinctipes TaxID=88211 RepID=A0AAE1KNS5_PETCI|nr:hypothetical protein Pcinc_017192 [Petrolisthes cinctipes]